MHKFFNGWTHLVRPKAEPSSHRIIYFWFLVFFVVLFLSFSLNQFYETWHKDGAIWTTQSEAQYQYRIPFSQLGVEPFEGSFDAYFPFSHSFSLPSILTQVVIGQYPSKLATHMILALFLIICCYAFARTIGFGRHIALLAGFLLPVLALPGLVNSHGRLYLLFSLVPDPIQVICFTLIICASLWKLDGAGSKLKNLLIFVPATTLMVAIVGFGGFLPIMVPATFLYGVTSLLDAGNNFRANLPRLMAMLLMIAVPALCGSLEYLYGLYSYTAYNFFSQEFQQVRNSLIFASSIWSGSFGLPVILLSYLGAIWIFLTEKGRLRLLASVHLVVTSVYLVLAVITVLYIHSYKGISPVYFETCMWPISLIFAAVTVLRLAKIISEGCYGFLPGKMRLYTRRSSSITLLIIVSITLAYNLRTYRRHKHELVGESFTMNATVITKLLEEKISLKPGQPFRGMVATLDGINEAKGVDWQDLHEYDMGLMKSTGNDHRMAGLWKYNIPTLIQNGNFRTPPYYLVLTDFLSKPDDSQERSGIVLTLSDQRMLQLLGVRYVITDSDSIRGDTVSEISLDWNNTVTSSAKTKLNKLRLIELPDPNLGNYFPTEVRRISDFRSGLRIMHDPFFDGKRTFVTDSEISTPLVPANSSQLVFEKYGFTLRAKSKGDSVIILPIQYSHCWNITGNGDPVLFRANLLQAGVKFHGELNAKLVFRYGPIKNGRCRLDDLADMKRLNIAEARPQRTPTLNFLNSGNVFAGVVNLQSGRKITQRFDVELSSLVLIGITVVNYGIQPSDYNIDWKIVEIIDATRVELGSGSIAAKDLGDWQKIKLPVWHDAKLKSGKLELEMSVKPDQNSSRPVGIPLYKSAEKNTLVPVVVDDTARMDGASISIQQWIRAR